MCTICCNSASDTTLPCSHSFCKKCLQQLLMIKINDGNVSELFCSLCKWKFTDQIILKLTSPKILDKYTKFTSLKEILMNIRAKVCPQPDCKGYDECTNNNFQLTCRVCNHRYCFWCSSEWHSGRCTKDKNDELHIWKAKGKLKLCPRCKSYISKKRGCNRVTCPKCSFEFCWMCENEMNSEHNNFNCFTGRKWNNLYWRTILLMIFFPFTWLFMFYAGFWYDFKTDFESSSYGLTKKIVLNALALIFSPVLTILCSSWLILLEILMWALDRIPEGGCLEIIFYIFLMTIGNSILMILSHLFFFSAIAVLSVVLPVLGIVFGVAKFIRNLDQHADDLSFMEDHKRKIKALDI